MSDIAAILFARQQKFQAKPSEAPASADHHPVFPRGLVLPPVWSLDPSANITPNLPESLDIGLSIFDRSQRKKWNGRPGHPAASAAEGPGGGPSLVRSSKTHRTHLPVHLDPSNFVPMETSCHYIQYAQDVFICRHPDTMPPTERPGGTRATIYEFSDKSRNHLNHVCCNSGHRIKSQFLLTYHDQNPQDGEEVKRHLDAFLKVYRRLFPGAGYLWVIEFQNRGTPHFHLFFTVAPEHEKQKTLAEAWVRITKGSDKQRKVHASAKNWLSWTMNSGGYLLKEYCVKTAQKDVPKEYVNVGRFWGCSRNMIPVGQVITPKQIADKTQWMPCGWDESSVSRFIERVMRKWQEHQMNRDKHGDRRRDQLGKVKPWKKASLTRQRGTLCGDFKIRNGAKILTRILHYIQHNCPDLYTIKATAKGRTPF